MRITPACASCLRKTNSPKSLSAVIHRQDDLIINAGIKFGDVLHSVSAFAERQNNGSIDALVRQEVQASRWLRRINHVSPQGFGGKSDGRADGLFSQSRMSQQDLIAPFTRGELVHDEFDSNTRPRDDGFPHHDPGIGDG